MNYVEGTMHVQNLGLQNVASDRARMATEYEDMLGGLGAVTKIRSKIESISDEQEREAVASAWAESMRSPIDMIKSRYQRLEFDGKPVQIQDPATKEGRC